MTQRLSRTREEILAGVRVEGGHVLVPCRNCGGSGNYPSSATPAGRCRFYCWTWREPGHELIPVDKYVKRQQRRDRKEAKAREARQKAAQELEDRSRDPDPRVKALAEAFSLRIDSNALEHDASFPADLIRSYLANGSLSENQWRWVVRLVERKEKRDAERANADPVPEGRVEVEGEVIKVDTRDGFRGGTRHVMTVKADAGWLVWGTVPRSIDDRGGGLVRGYTSASGGTKGIPADAPAFGRGARVRFTATVEAKDRSFGIYKKPAKAELIHPRTEED